MRSTLLTLATRFRSVTRVAAATAVAAALFGGALGHTATARADNTTPGTCGYVLLAGSGWLGGSGVDVHLNTGGWYNGSWSPYNSCGGNSYVASVFAGTDWQCVELINRLYLTRGWTNQTWGGDGWQMYGSAPPNLNKQSEGNITYLDPGDVIVFNQNFFSPYGHVGVVEMFNRAAATGTMVSQNVGIDFRWTIALSGGTLTVPNHAGSSQITGVVHAPVTHSYVAQIPNVGASGYRVDGYGDLYPFGNAPPITSRWGAPWTNWDIVRGIALLPDSTTSAARGYVLDGWGGIHPFAAGNAVPPPAPTQYAYWQGWDIARGIVVRDNTGSGYVLDGWGGIHPFAPSADTMPPAPNQYAYWSGWDIARGIAPTSAGSGYVLDGWGGIHPFAAPGFPLPAAPATAAYWGGWDIARGIAITSTGSGYVLDGWGGVHPFAAAGVPLPPALGNPAYSPGGDIFRGIAADPYSGAVAVGSGDTGPGTGSVVDLN